MYDWSIFSYVQKKATTKKKIGKKITTFFSLNLTKKTVHGLFRCLSPVRNEKISETCLCVKTPSFEILCSFMVGTHSKIFLLK